MDPNCHPKHHIYFLLLKCFCFWHTNCFLSLIHLALPLRGETKVLEFGRSLCCCVRSWLFQRTSVSSLWKTIKLFLLLKRPVDSFRGDTPPPPRSPPALMSATKLNYKWWIGCIVIHVPPASRDRAESWRLMSNICTSRADRWKQLETRPAYHE